MCNTHYRSKSTVIKCIAQKQYRAMTEYEQEREMKKYKWPTNSPLSDDQIDSISLISVLLLTVHL